MCFTECNKVVDGVFDGDLERVHLVVRVSRPEDRTPGGRVDVQAMVGTSLTYVTRGRPSSRSVVLSSMVSVLWRV
jgi:hypothetical protein